MYTTPEPLTSVEQAELTKLSQLQFDFEWAQRGLQRTAVDLYRLLEIMELLGPDYDPAYGPKDKVDHSSYDGEQWVREALEYCDIPSALKPSLEESLRNVGAHWHAMCVLSGEQDRWKALQMLGRRIYELKKLAQPSVDAAQRIANPEPKSRSVATVSGGLPGLPQAGTGFRRNHRFS